MPLVGLGTQFTVGELCASAVEHEMNANRKASARMRKFARAQCISADIVPIKLCGTLKITDFFEMTQNYLRIMGSFNVVMVFGQRESRDCPHCSQASHGIGTKTYNDLHRSSMNHLAQPPQHWHYLAQSDP